MHQGDAPQPANTCLEESRHPDPSNDFDVDELPADFCAGDDFDVDELPADFCAGCNPEPTLEELDSGRCASCGGAL